MGKQSTALTLPACHQDLINKSKGCCRPIAGSHQPIKGTLPDYQRGPISLPKGTLSAYQRGPISLPTEPYRPIKGALSAYQPINGTLSCYQTGLFR